MQQHGIIVSTTFYLYQSLCLMTFPGKGVLCAVCKPAATLGLVSPLLPTPAQPRPIVFMQISLLEMFGFAAVGMGRYNNHQAKHKLHPQCSDRDRAGMYF